MKNDIIPKYNALFKDDEFCLPEEPGCEELAYALSYFGYLYTEKDTMNKTFFEESIGAIDIDLNNAKKMLNHRVLITEYGVLAAWKSIFNFYNKNQVYDHNNLKITFNYLYRLIVKEQEEYLNHFEKVSKKNSLMTNSFLNYLDNPSFAFARFYYIFIKNKDKFLKDKAYKGYNEIFKKFNDEYKIDVISYLQALTVLVFFKCEVNFTSLKNSHNMINNNFVITPLQIKNSETKEKVIKVLKLLSFNYVEASNWAMETYKNNLDFSLFQEKPIYMLNKWYYVPVARKFLQDQLFISLIYKMRKLYPEENKSFFILFGKLFEYYLIYIFRQVIRIGNIKYNLIEEFSYSGKKTEKKSPDMIICWKNDVYVFELKSARVLNNVYKIDNELELEKSIDKIIKKPILQAMQRVTEIVDEEVKPELNKTKNYYFIAVTLNNLPIYYSNFDIIEQEKENCNFKISGMINLSVEEYELLCDATIKQKKSLGFFFDDFLYNYQNEYSFKNYIRHYRTGTTTDIFSEFTKDMQEFTNSIEI